MVLFRKPTNQLRNERTASALAVHHNSKILKIRNSRTEFWNFRYFDFSIFLIFRFVDLHRIAVELRKMCYFCLITTSKIGKYCVLTSFREQWKRFVPLNQLVVDDVVRSFFRSFVRACVRACRRSFVRSLAWFSFVLISFSFTTLCALNPRLLIWSFWLLDL